MQMSELADSLLCILSGMGTKARLPKMQSHETSPDFFRSSRREHVSGNFVEEGRGLQGVPPVDVRWLRVGEHCPDTLDECAVHAVGPLRCVAGYQRWPIS